MTGEGGTGRDGKPLTTFTVNLSAPAWSALEDAARRTGQSRTDITNIALMLYAHLAELGEHEGVYRATVDNVAGRRMYLRVSRYPWKRWPQ